MPPGTRVIVILINGGPISSPWLKQNAHALLEAWYPGEEGGTALAELLLGLANPSGRLSVSIVASDRPEDLPHRLSLSMSEGPGRTYRYHNRPALFRFGFGLSYTHFAYHSFQVEPAEFAIDNPPQMVQLSVTLANIGSRSGVETVQVYVEFHDSLTHDHKPWQPLRQLLLFERVELESSHSQTLTLQLSPKDLPTFQLPTGTLGLAYGSYSLVVGGCSPLKSRGFGSESGCDHVWQKLKLY